MRVYIDGSHSFCTSRSTGIERVVRKLDEHLRALGRSDHGLSVTRVIHFQGRFSEVTPQFRSDLDWLTNFERNPTCFMNRHLKRILQQVISVFPSSKFRSLVLPESSHLGLYNLPYKFIKRKILQKWSRNFEAINPSKGDILFLPDAYWTRRDIWKTVQRVRESGVTVVSVFYDLIPVTHVHYVGKQRSDKFRGYLKDLLDHSDVVLAISKTVRNELAEYARRDLGMRFAENKIRSFRLGADMNEGVGTIRDNVLSFFRPEPQFGNTKPYVVVGSLDPRKNHIQVLEAFEQLQQSGNPRRLCFVGRSGGLSKEIISRMNRSSLGSKLLTHFSDLGDAELHYVYKNIEAAIMPSVVEGFGLPIVEALWHGARIYASDIPIHREVGGSDCKYFPLHRADLLAELIVENESDDAKHTSRCIVPTSWHESAVEVLQHFRTCGLYDTREAKCA